MSSTTVLRQVRQRVRSVPPIPDKLGVDDWAFRKGKQGTLKYGTLLVDLERHQPIELLSDRSASSLARWLEAHPDVQVITRDRAKDYYNPPSKPIFVPGMNWAGLLVMGMTGAPTVAAMPGTLWVWSTCGLGSSDKRREEGKLLRHCCKRWGTQVLHVFEHGFAGSPWLQQLLKRRLCFVMRWRQEYDLVDSQGNKRKAWQICRGKRSLAQRLIWDASRHCERKIGIYYTQVFHPDFPNTPFWLVVSRQGKGRKPWYLLINQPVDSVDHAFSLIRAYARRWQIEMAWRYTKSELAFESPRLHRWDNRLKLFLIATLAYAFPVSLLDSLLKDFRLRLLCQFCHRTGKRCRDASTPLYRLRDALAKLWTAYPRSLDPLPLLLNSG